MPSCRKYTLPVDSPPPFNQSIKIIEEKERSLYFKIVHYYTSHNMDIFTSNVRPVTVWRCTSMKPTEPIKQQWESTEYSKSKCMCSAHCAHIFHICECICCKITFLPQWSLAQFKVVEWRMCEAALALTSLPGWCIFHDYNPNTFFRMGTNISGQNFLFLPDYNWKNTDFLFVGYDAVFV